MRIRAGMIHEAPLQLTSKRVRGTEVLDFGNPSQVFFRSFSFFLDKSEKHLTPPLFFTTVIKRKRGEFSFNLSN